MQRKVRRPKQKPAISFRIEEETTRALKSLAETEHISLNALVNNILKENVNFFIPAKKYGSKLLHGKILKRLIDEIDAARLNAIALDMGKSTFSVINESGWMPANSVGLRRTMCDLFCICANWANYREENRGNRTYINLMHEWGVKWSTFMKSFFEWEFTQLSDLKASDVSFTCSESCLDISFQEPLIVKA